MKVKDIISVVYSRDNVCIYHRTDDDDLDEMFRDDYIGEPENVPKELLEREVFIISPTRRSRLEIQIVSEKEKSS